MGKLNASKISEFVTERAKRSEELIVLTSSPFDLDNKKHTRALKKYIDNFELTANQMHLFEGMSAGLTTWGGSWVVGFFLPIPDFANYFLTMFLYFGAAGYVLEHFSKTDFIQQLAEMKTIYNWCLKGGQENYSSAVDNTVNLSSPDIQRLIKLIAPFCSTEFMLAWKPKKAEKEEQKGGLSSVFSTGYAVLSTTYAVVSSPYSLFSSSEKPNADLERMRELKINELKDNIETRGYDVGIFNGLEQAIKYFATSPDFREIMAAKVRQPVETVKNMVPSALLGSFSPSSSN